MPAPGDTDLAAVGSVLADPARAKVLLALGDGRSLPASMLALEAGVAASTASHHLARLVDAGLITVTTRGRYRYYRLAGPQVGELIEAVARVAPAKQVTSLREGTRAHAVRLARRCYDHLAGRLGVAVTDALREQGALDGGDQGVVDLDRMTGDRPTGGVLDPAGYTVTAHGVAVFDRFGVVAREGSVVRCCVDWTEQRHHLAGPLGRALLTSFLDREWVSRRSTDRAVAITDAGRRELADFGVALPA